MANPPPRQPTQPPHDLDDENMLERALRKSPDFLRDYGTYLLLGLCVLAAGWWYYNSRAAAEAVRGQNTAQGLSNLARTVSSAEAAKRTAAFQTPDKLARQQSELTSEFDANAASVTGEGHAGGASRRVLRLRGDFAWVNGARCRRRPAEDAGHHPARRRSPSRPRRRRGRRASGSPTPRAAYTPGRRAVPQADQPTTSRPCSAWPPSRSRRAASTTRAGFTTNCLARDDLGDGDEVHGPAAQGIAADAGRRTRGSSPPPPPPPASQPADAGRRTNSRRRRMLDDAALTGASPHPALKSARQALNGDRTPA